MARGKGLPLDPVRLRAARTAAGLSQRQVAEALGTTRQQLIRYESGAERPEVTRLAALAAAVGVGVGDLVQEGALPAGLAGLRVEAGLTLAAAATAVRAHLPAGSGVACSRPVLADAERGVLPPSWAPPPAAGAVQGALGVAYGTGVEQVVAAWKATFGATGQEAEEAGSLNGTPDEVFSETTPSAPVPLWTAELPVCPYSPSELNAAHVKDHGNGVYQVRVDHTPQGWVRRDGTGRWSYAAHDPDTGRPRTWTPVLAPSPTRARAVEALLSTPGPLWSAPMPGSEEGAPRPVTPPPADAVELPFGNDGQEHAQTPDPRAGVRLELLSPEQEDPDPVPGVAVLISGDPTGDRPYLRVQVDGHDIGHLEDLRTWNDSTGWAFYSRPTEQEHRSKTGSGGRPPEAITTVTDIAAAVRELLPRVLEGPVRITAVHGRHTGLTGMSPQHMERWELYQGKVPGREDVYARGRCWGWLQPATGGFTAHTTAGPVPGGPHPTREEAVVALWAHLTAPLPPPALGERASTTRRVRPPRDARPLCPYTPEELARVRLVRDRPDGEHSPYRAESPVDMRVLGYVWRKDARRWSYAPADPDTGRPPEYTPALPTAATRAAALERLLSRPGPLWADPASTILHPPGHADTPAPDPGPGAVVDMTERIGPGWALRREGEADAHTWLVTYEGRVRGMVRRYRPRGGGLSRGWEALAGAGGPGGFLRRSATQQGKFGARSSFLWRSRDLAAWGIATDPPFDQPSPVWARRRPAH